jgi:hypothetical protein
MGLLNDNNYQKGAWVLHMLRRQLGDEAFKGVRTITTITARLTPRPKI